MAGRSSLYADCAVVGVGPLSLVGRTWRVRPSTFVRQHNHQLGHASRSAGLVGRLRGAYGDVAATYAPQAVINFIGVVPDSHLWFSEAGVAAGEFPQAQLF